MRTLLCVRRVVRFTCRILLAIVSVAVGSRLATAAPDTLVVCPVAFRPALVEWDRYRQSQGHELSYVTPPGTAAELKAIVRKEARSRELKFVVLIGDVPASDRSSTAVPTNYVPAKVNVRWGSTALIASDIPYADLRR